LLAEAAAALRDVPLLGARAAEDAGTAGVAAGDTARAGDLLAAAMAVYERADAQQSLRRAGAAMRAAGLRPAIRRPRRRPTVGWEALTETERQVVALAVEGLTNPEIGARLYISRRTVQTHLAHVFAKLGLSSRVELAAAAAARQPSGQ
jgi:DNA-binding CsgD family transcriptional regulator